MSRLEFQGQHTYPDGFALDVRFTTTAIVTALFGPSGSGKTSILSMLAGLRRPQQGRIMLGARVLFDSAARVNVAPESRRIGYVFQDHLLFPHLNVRENLLYGRRRRPTARAIDWEQLIAILELGELLERAPHTLSGGQRQRVAVGRAMLSGPDLLLMDEPLASVHDELKDRLVDYLAQLIAIWQVPMLYVTHDERELRRLDAQVVRLDQGRVVEMSQ